MQVLEIRPVCSPEVPRSLDELRTAIKGVLTALAELHTREIVHRDVRWPNTLRHQDLWILSDFESADFAGNPLPHGAIASGHVPPELRSHVDAGYQPAGDVYCVGRLLEGWRGTEALPADVRAWSLRLVEADPAARPTARQLLDEQGSWLACNRS